MRAPIDVLTATELTALSGQRADRRAGKRGDLDRLRRGLYAERTRWTSADEDDRYLTRILAARQRLEGEVVFSHESALRLLGLPAPARWPEEVHLLCERRSGGRTQLDIRRHCLGWEAAPTVEAYGVRVTSPARTAVDMALSRPLPAAVVAADAVLRCFPDARAEYVEILQLLGPKYRGLARAGRVLDFADPGSESPGESISRVHIAQLGFARPELQKRVRDADGFAGRLDFFWPAVGVGGEFDGRGKYLDPELTGGLSAGEVVLREKRREDRLRRSLRALARWTADDLRDGAARLGAILTAAGVPRH